MEHIQNRLSSLKNPESPRVSSGVWEKAKVMKPIITIIPSSVTQILKAVFMGTMAGLLSMRHRVLLAHLANPFVLGKIHIAGYLGEEPDTPFVVPFVRIAHRST